jgi:hypothetical protein
MAKSRSSNKDADIMKTAQLPEGVRKLDNQLTWDPTEMPLLEGSIAGFGASPAKNFNDGNWFPGKTQRIIKVQPNDGPPNTLYIVYEGGNMSALFDLAIGTHIAIAFTGMRKVEGRNKPVRVFEIGVYE